MHAFVKQVHHYFACISEVSLPLLVAQDTHHIYASIPDLAEGWRIRMVR